MQAIILAAGMGKRLGELTCNNTKCMIRVNGKTLIERMLGQLDKLHLKRIILVVGYKGKELRDFISGLDINTPIQYVTNSIYDKSNNIYSLFLAKDLMAEDDTILLESDLIFEDRLLETILEDIRPNIALVARLENWMSGTAVTLDGENNITGFVDAKHQSFDNPDIYYKTVNIYKFSQEFSETHYIPFLQAYCSTIGKNEYYEQVLRVISFIDKSALKALPLENNEAWYEIDDIQDLDIAESIFSDEKIKKIQSRYGGYWRYPGILDFCYLVNPFYPDKRMKDEIRCNFDKLISNYPSGQRVNKLIAARNFRVKPEYISVGNGASELIKCLTEKHLSGKTGFVFPTFEEYPNRTARENAVYFIPDNENFSYTADDLMNYFSGKGISALVLLNPDNPSGNFISKQELLRLCIWAEEKKIRLIIDESFVDFSTNFHDNSLINNDILSKYPHLVIIKSISKSYGVPGLRLGIMVSADVNMISEINRDLPIWNINSFAEFYMQISCKYEREYEKACLQFIEERERFRNALENTGFLRVIPSQGNYFLCEVSGYSASELTKKLLERNILVKDCSGKKGFEQRKNSYIRIAVRNRQDNEKLVRTLESLK